MELKLKSIGTIRTPHIHNAPDQPVEHDEGDFRVVLNPEYTSGLHELESFRYIYLVYYMDRMGRVVSMRAKPPRAGGIEVGVFASRSPARPNPIGLSIVRLLRIVNNVLFTSGLDVLDGTPLLDIKPYLKDLDSKQDANNGWATRLRETKREGGS